MDELAERVDTLERYREIVEAWDKATEEIKEAVQETMDEFGPISMMATCRSCESTNDWRSPGSGTGAPSRWYSANRPEVAVFDPSRMASTNWSRRGPGKPNSAFGSSVVTRRT